MDGKFQRIVFCGGRKVNFSFKHALQNIQHWPKIFVCMDDLHIFRLDYECSAPGLDQLVDTALALGALGKAII
jgi:hypothetical protein